MPPERDEMLLRYLFASALAGGQILAAYAFVVGRPVRKSSAVFLDPDGDDDVKPAPADLPPPRRKPAPRPLEHIFKQNARWVETKMLTNPDYFQELGSRHTPKYLWIGE